MPHGVLFIYITYKILYRSDSQICVLDRWAVGLGRILAKILRTWMGDERS